MLEAPPVPAVELAVPVMGFDQPPRIRATLENPYADFDALMAAIDEELANARDLIEEEERKRKKLRPLH